MRKLRNLWTASFIVEAKGGEFPIHPTLNLQPSNIR